MSDVLSSLNAALADRYRLERELGAGGMATVYLAQDLKHQRRVAIKVLRPELAAAIGADRFLREITTTASLRHPHILPLYDSGAAGETLFYVMPFVDGESLRERLQREKQLPLDDALQIAREVADALSYAHGRGIVHRDIKPENIMLEAGHAVVADFGIAKAISAASGDTLTQTGMAIGTPSYMSPEQAAGDGELDGRSDLYALGCVLYEMLAGQPPFTGPTVESVVHQHLVADPRPISLLRPAVPAPVVAALQRALAKAPADRFNPVALFSEAIRSGAATPQPTPAAAAPAHRSSRGVVVMAALAVIAIAAGLVLWRRSSGSTPAGAASVAVLPFVDLSPDRSSAYLGDGMAETIINALAKVPGLQVASRSSCFAFKGKHADIREVGEKLGVGTVLEGSVRKVGNRIRINAQLVNVENGYHLWSETYDRQLEDVFAIQDEISRAIVEALKLRLGSEAGQLVVPTKNLEAYNLYLKARFFYHRFTEASLNKSLDFYQRVLRLEPGYARAYAGVADCWCRLADDWVAPDDAYSRAKGAASRALQLDPQLAEAMTALGKVNGWYDWDFAASEQHLRTAVTLSPNYAEAHWAFGSVLPAVGKMDEAIEEIRKALTLDPLDPGYSRWLARFLLYAGEHHGAIAQGEKIIELGEDFFPVYLDIGSAYLCLGDFGKALEWYRRGQALESSVRSYDAYIVRALAASNRREEAEEIMSRLEEESRQHYLRTEFLAMGYAALGNLDQAFECLERAFQARSAGLIYLNLDPGYAPLRADPRFAELVQRIGLK